MNAPKRENISPKAVDIIKRIYAIAPMGCCWHVVLEDNNYDYITETCNTVLTSWGVGCETKGACFELALLNLTPSMMKRANYRARISTLVPPQRPVVTIVLNQLADGSIDMRHHANVPIELHVLNQSSHIVSADGSPLEFIGPVQQYEFIGPLRPVIAVAGEIHIDE